MIMGFFGLPGSGKSTFLAQLAKRYQKRSIKVYTLASAPVDGCYMIKFSDLGQFHIENSIILIDEISLFADNRDYKEFSQKLKEFFILHRHYGCDIVWYTQQYDGVDRKIRELTTCLYYVRSMGMFSVAVRINRFIHIEKEKKSIMVGYKMAGIFARIFTKFNKSFLVVFRPKYYRYFDSFAAPRLPRKDFKLFKVKPLEAPKKG